MVTRAQPGNRWLTVVLAGTLLGLLPGCGDGIPKTYPVKGKVVFKGGPPPKGGHITFQQVADPKIVADGDIKPDGSFTLTTKLLGKSREGAPEGEYTVMVEEPGSTGADGQLVIRPVVVSKKYKVAPGDNDLTIEAEKWR